MYLKCDFLDYRHKGIRFVTTSEVEQGKTLYEVFEYGLPKR